MHVTKPESITIGRATVATRNPVALWILTFLTLGIWGIVWWYQVNRELRDYSEAVARPFGNVPVAATVCALLYWVAFWPGMISVFVTARRVRTVQDWVEAPGRAAPIVAALLFPLLFAHTWYLQRALNDAWLRAREGAGPPPDYTVASGQGERLATQTEIDRLGRATRWR